MPSRATEKTDTNRSESKSPTPGQSIVAALSERFDLAEHRRYLARELEGVILDLGAGSGAMVPYLQTAVQREPALRLHALEPDPDRRRQAEQTATTHNLDIHLQSGRAESLPYADDTFDVVIASAVFCTVQDPLLALEEVRRVVKPDGEFRFLEHVRSDGLRGYVQDVVTPLWKRIDNGCRLNRRTDDWIASGPFALDEIETLSIGVSPSRPFVRGTATPVRRTETDDRILK
ncbi:class I SAM-dependent methyltransferase [Natrialba asiatica]|uniref:Type 11 methyltransferase n=1 Tax=Natrialba asiatica (strain ATCC 700177 / DSM 12278 / JCM 9576 / FERM P-10747 / NBRC 102637 / 172P1) TaxID=29540 RepID=M0AUH6_NATA1|nr:class I SAM-dependent methyltransferase [Natrialba asiatica]ELZ01987.1 type 11 methyltransferase [Natrialba asiatica DSM 12278]